ncbi:hypothetical protein [Pseudomonas kurunegalensis]|uniref:hypothetical protein n=1 Tax=Pseudomonas kurunegalensis TaxID=485880 RepID=UPI002570C2B7|nr:hypothetical protein [Pseudomonas kurunegalensis]WJD60629.1 hypothetical protein QQ992_16975 [Pseudomonas kurunegalensis]
MIEATEKQLELLWHTLGLHPECRLSSRNYFLTSPGYDDANNLDVLVEAGLMTRGKAPAFCDPGDVVYRATPEGKQFAREKLPPAPPPRKYTKFDAYLDECECYDGFAHFLGINLPFYQQRGEWRDREYRMVRYPRGSVYHQYRRHYSFVQWSPYETLEVAGEWAPTLKAAKASYKEALRLHQAKGRADRKRLAA